MSPTAKNIHPAAKSRVRAGCRGTSTTTPSASATKMRSPIGRAWFSATETGVPPAVARMVFSASAAPMAAAPRLAITALSHRVGVIRPDSVRTNKTSAREANG